LKITSTNFKTKRNMENERISLKQVKIERVINAPIEMVFRAWTDPAQLEKWHAPNGCSIHYEKINVRVGGEFLSCVHVPNFKDCWCKGTYLEIEKNKRLVYTMCNCDEKGNEIDPAEIGMDKEWPAHTTVTIVFSEENGKTKIDLRQTVSEALAKKTGAYPSWLQMFDILESQLTN
jgi:uncharacterized protein YndB with AHSA1/START domain